MYLFETEDFYKDISPDINEMFDTNDYPKISLYILIKILKL